MTELLLEHPPASTVSVKVYVVVTVGLAIGLDTVELLKPVAGLQLYVLLPTGAAPICTEEPEHIV